MRKLIKPKKVKLTKPRGEFEKYLERVEDPKNNREVNYGLPKNPTSTQIVKYKLCKKMLDYQQNHNLTDEETAERIGFSLSPAEVEDILYCCIDKFTLDRLTEYASALFAPCEIEVNVRESEKKTSRKRIHAHPV